VGASLKRLFMSATEGASAWSSGRAQEEPSPGFTCGGRKEAAKMPPAVVEVNTKGIAKVVQKERRIFGVGLLFEQVFSGDFDFYAA
jgi:hypothetical protein